MKFKVGDIIRGKKDNGYMWTDGLMTKGKVIEVDDCDDMRIEILEHTYVDVIGKRYNVDNNDNEFELVNTELDKLQRKLEKHENKVKEIKEKIKALNKIEVGDTVKVINHDHTYSTFYKWVEREISDIDVRYCFDINNEPENGFICEVLHIAKHSEHLLTFVNNDTLAYVKHLDTGRCYLISVDGLEKC